MVRVHYIPSSFADVDPGPFNIAISGEPVQVRGFGCWSGIGGSWHPNAPLDINPSGPATITVTHSGVITPSVTTTSYTPDGRSYFELPLDPVTVPPYLVRVAAPESM